MNWGTHEVVKCKILAVALVCGFIRQAQQLVKKKKNIEKCIFDKTIKDCITKMKM